MSISNTGSQSVYSKKPITLEKNAPLDARQEVHHYSDLESLVSEGMVYEDMRVYVLDMKRYYRYITDDNRQNGMWVLDDIESTNTHRYGIQILRFTSVSITNSKLTTGEDGQVYLDAEISAELEYNTEPRVASPMDNLTNHHGQRIIDLLSVEVHQLELPFDSDDQGNVLICLNLDIVQPYSDGSHAVCYPVVESVVTRKSFFSAPHIYYSNEKASFIIGRINREGAIKITSVHDYLDFMYDGSFIFMGDYPALQRNFSKLESEVNNRLEYLMTPVQIGRWMSRTPVWRIAFSYVITEDDVIEGNNYRAEIISPFYSVVDHDKAFTTSVNIIHSTGNPSISNETNKVTCEHNGSTIVIASPDRSVNLVNTYVYGYYEFVADLESLLVAPGSISFTVNSLQDGYITGTSSQILIDENGDATFSGVYDLHVDSNGDGTFVKED